MQRPSRPPLAPPSGPLPPLPKTRNNKPLPNVPLPVDFTSLLPTPTPSRSVTLSSLPTLKSTKVHSTSSVPTLAAPPASPSALPTPGKTLRKTISIGAFPQPPRGTRLSSLPPSPLSTTTLSPGTSEAAGIQLPKSPPVGTRRPSAKPRSSGYGVQLSRTSTASSTTPSLLNGIGGDRTISSALGAPGPDAFLCPPSPPRSRRSSAEGSCNTDGTHFEDIGEDARGRPKSADDVTHSKKSPGLRDGKGNVVVSVRVRPDAGNAEGANVSGEWMVDGRRSLVSYKGREGGEHRYDNVFSQSDNNARVYDAAAKRLVRRVMEGYHGTVFAYGMTGTGKTFSMQGTARSPGVIPLAITDIFSYIRENPAREFLLRVSYLEIYNERIYDLLSPGAGGARDQEEIKLREDSRRGVYATPLREEIVQSPNQLLRVIARGDQARKVSSTQFNVRSSRSHAVVQIVVESRKRSPAVGLFYEKDSHRSEEVCPGGVLVSTLSLIDLAGSEKAAESKERRTEGAHINKSLLTLGTVIARLSGDKDKDGADKDKDQKHLPYRDSKLTRLLQPALSGNSLVSILCTIQLSSSSSSSAAANAHTGETLNTLKFASRAKNNIVSHARRNESSPANAGDPGSRALLDRYRLEIVELRRQLEQQNKMKDEAERREEEAERQRERVESEERHEEQMLEMQLARTALKERISHLNRLILSSKSLGVNTGRFSSASAATKRTSVFSTNEYGVVPSTRSGRSQRDSTGTTGLPNGMPALDRTVSVGSTVTGYLPAARASQVVLADDSTPSSDEEEDSAGSNGDGTATSGQRIRALQADLADKNRYVATLEKRLLQARRSSHSRASMTFATRHDESNAGQIIREKDLEIEELRARLDDQTRMVTALRSAARKRDMLDSKEITDRRESSKQATEEKAAEASSRMSHAHDKSHFRAPSHRSHPSNASSGAGIQNFSRLTPVALLSPSGKGEYAVNGEGASKSSRGKSVDEMTRMLDEMIQDKVDTGQVVRGERGSLSIKRDLVIEKDDSLSPAVPGAEVQASQ